MYQTCLEDVDIHVEISVSQKYCNHIVTMLIGDKTQGLFQGKKAFSLMMIVDHHQFK